MKIKIYMICVLSLAIFCLIGFFSTSYAYFVYDKVSSKEHTITMGELKLTYSGETTAFHLTNMFPMSPSKARLRNDNTISFTLTGKNTTEDRIYYEIDLDYGDVVNGKNRIADQFLSFDLTEQLESGASRLVVTGKKYSSLDHQRIYVNTIDVGETSNINRSYTLRFWVNEDLKVSDSASNADYTTSEFANLYASVKVNVYGDLVVKDYEKSLYDIMSINGVSDHIASTYVTASTGVDFSEISSDTNGKGIYLRYGTETDDYPIYYYRGAVDNNNVLFANKCWKAVRTTDTGGVKLIYNGENTGTIDEPNCNNTGTDTQISLSGITTFAFNTSYKSPAYNGYMYGYVYTYASASATSGAYFGSSFTYDGTNYTLVDATTKDNTHHYTCNLTSADGTCTTIRYYYYGDYYVNLTGGDGIEEAMTKMQTNTNDSNAKDKIDTWYASNLTSYTNKLEDTIWCNDRSMGDGNNNGWIANGGDLSTYLIYGATQRSNYASNTSTVKNQPSLACANKNDSFTVSNANGNQALTYPVAMITEDEAVLAGGLAGIQYTTFYLNNGSSYWSLSPYYFYYSALEFRVVNGRVNDDYVDNAYGLRPAVSLKFGTSVASGTGTVSDPFVIE